MTKPPLDPRVTIVDGVLHSPANITPKVEHCPDHDASHTTWVGTYCATSQYTGCKACYEPWPCPTARKEHPMREPTITTLTLEGADGRPVLTFTPTSPTIGTTMLAGKVTDAYPGVRLNPPSFEGPPTITYPTAGWRPLTIRGADTVRIAPTPEGGIKLTIDGPRWTADYDTPTEDTP